MLLQQQRSWYCCNGDGAEGASFLFRFQKINKRIQPSSYIRVHQIQLTTATAQIHIVDEYFVFKLSNVESLSTIQGLPYLTKSLVADSFYTFSRQTNTDVMPASDMNPSLLV